MPRVIDFKTGNETEWNETRLPNAPLYGKLEITSQEIEAISRALNSPVMGFEPQFSTYGKSISAPESGAKFDAAHSWLSANATGPWLWTEYWSNHGHHLDIAIFVERMSDQLAFAGAHADLFDYRAPEEYALAQLAVCRGVLAPLTALESFSTWSTEHSGFNILPSDDLGGDGLRLVFSHEGLEADFARAFSSRFAVRNDNGRRVYEGNVPRNSWRDSPVVWLSSNAAVGSISGGHTQGEYKYSVVTRYDDTAAALTRDWGHIFRAEDGERTFWATKYPYPPTRTVPPDFMAYLTGDRDTYEAPHLAEELKVFRAVR